MWCALSVRRALLRSLAKPSVGTVSRLSSLLGKIRLFRCRGAQRRTLGIAAQESAGFGRFLRCAHEVITSGDHLSDGSEAPMSAPTGETDDGENHPKGHAQWYRGEERRHRVFVAEKHEQQAQEHSVEQPLHGAGGRDARVGKRSNHVFDLTEVGSDDRQVLNGKPPFRQ